MLNVGRLLALYRTWTPACDLSEFGLLGVCRVAHPAPPFATRSLLPPCHPRSSSPHEVLSPTRAAVLDRADPQARQERSSPVSSTRTADGRKREGRMARWTVRILQRKFPCPNPKMIDILFNSFTCEPVSELL